jgi:hypothetical protein
MLVHAWLLTEGDQALTGETILLLHRDALRRTVTVVWDDGQRAELAGDAWIALGRRAFTPTPAVPRRGCPDPSLTEPPMTARSRRDSRRCLDDRSTDHHR